MTETTPRTELQPMPSEPWDTLRRNWKWFLVLGIVWIVLGSLAIILPHVAALAINLVIGALLAVGGLLQIVQSWRCTGWNGKILHAVIGVLSLIAGAVLILYPLQGVATLTLVLSAFFIAAGAIRTVLAVQSRGATGWGWMLLSGLLALAVGVIIWMAWPGSALWALGLLVGIELIFSGWAMVMFALGVRDA